MLLRRQWQSAEERSTLRFAGFLRQRGGTTVGQIAESSAAPLSASRELLELVLANLVDGVLVVDAKGGRIYANAEAARLTGYPSAEALLHAPPDEAFQRFEV